MNDEEGPIYNTYEPARRAHNRILYMYTSAIETSALSAKGSSHTVERLTFFFLQFSIAIGHKLL